MEHKKQDASDKIKRRIKKASIRNIRLTSWINLDHVNSLKHWISQAASLKIKGLDIYNAEHEHCEYVKMYRRINLFNIHKRRTKDIKNFLLPINY